MLETLFDVLKKKRMPSLAKKKPKAAAASAAASSFSSSPSELANLLLADPVANANLLPRLLALEAVPSDEVKEKEGMTPPLSR